jgi:predicted MFS family arabinose efflux permease
VSTLPSLSSEAAELPALDEAGPPQNPTVPLSLSMFLIGTGEVIASPMMLEMAQTFGVSSARVAWLPGIYALTYASLGPLLGLSPIGSAARRCSRRAWSVSASA